MTNEDRNWVITIGALLIALIVGGFMLNKALEPPLVIVREVQVTPSSTTSTTIVQVNEWCRFLEQWEQIDEIAAAEEWVNGQEPFDEVQNAMIEFAACSEFGKETARLIWPLWFGE